MNEKEVRKIITILQRNLNSKMTFKDKQKIAYLVYHIKNLDFVRSMMYNLRKIRYIAELEILDNTIFVESDKTTLKHNENIQVTISVSDYEI